MAFPSGKNPILEVGKIAVIRNNGKFAENAKIVQNGIIQPSNLMAIGNLAFSVGSIIFAQAHMQIIERQLTEIKEELQKIQQWQEDKDISALTGIISWLQNDFFSVFQNKIHNPEWRKLKIQEISGETKELYKIQDNLNLSIDRLFKKIDPIINKDGSLSSQFDTNWIGTKAGYEALQSLGKDIHKYIERLSLLNRVSNALNFASLLLDPSEQILTPFTSKIEDLLQKLRISSELCSQASKLLFNYSTKSKIAIMAITPFSPLGASALIGNELIKQKREKEISTLFEQFPEIILQIEQAEKKIKKQIQNFKATPKKILIETNSQGKIINANVPKLEF